MRLILAILAALLVGCLPELSAEAKKPHQDEAVKLVWEQVYGMKPGLAPTIEWAEGADLDCPWDPGVSFKFGDTCAFGAHDNDRNLIRLALPTGPPVPYWKLPFAHELCHAKSFLETGDGDANHTGPCFNSPEDWDGLAQQALMDAGLMVE